MPRCYFDCRGDTPKLIPFDKCVEDRLEDSSFSSFELEEGKHMAYLYRWAPGESGVWMIGKDPTGEILAEMELEFKI